MSGVFLTCGNNRFFTFSAASDGRKIKKIKAGLTDAITCFILNKTVAACGFGAGGPD